MPNRAILHSSDAIIKKALKKIAKEQLPNERLIGPRNHFVDDTISKIQAYTLSSSKKDHLAQYVAASTITHCYDGWNFLSRGIESYLNGDISSTIHFVYYSELRAVMSLMASNGIGIFNNRHLYFDSTEQDFAFTKSTHKAADTLMNELSLSSVRKAFIFKLIKVNNWTLNDWIRSTGASTGSSYASSIVNIWLKKWSIDLRLNQDQELRNEMSYRPHFNINEVIIKEGIKKILSVWKCLEPSISNRFNELDKYLLRLVIEEIFKLSTGHRISHKSFTPFVASILSNLGESSSHPLFNFLTRRDIPDDHFIITEAKKDTRSIRVNLLDPLPMICRSILLLRLSTGAANCLLEECGIVGNSLKFWWENTAYLIGLISSKPSGLNSYDLYADINQAMENLQPQVESISSVNEAIFSYAHDLNTIKQFQRVSFWGLGL